LEDGVEQRRFASDPIVQRILPLLEAERFFDDTPTRSDPML
jgi:hypothetical protein